ncbi:hypothetical protein [Streptomyces sp. LN699]|uniref:hypothetical protein n=1 Tax=Streptomyces sp. LN699 TaxID=3112981 RepID=UPI00371A67A3
MKCPTTKVLPTPGRRGVFTVFEGGSIHWSAATGAHPVWGAVTRPPPGPAQCRAVRGRQVCITWVREDGAMAEVGTFDTSGRVRCSTPKAWMTNSTCTRRWACCHHAGAR